MARDEAYEIAEAKIREARRSGAVHLSLGRDYGKDLPPLTEVPQSVCELSQLESLNLSNHELTTIPEGLDQLSQLQQLIVSNNRLTELPKSLGKLTELRSLNVSGNALRALFELSPENRNLQSLIISSNRLTSLPESIVYLERLRELHAERNQLSTLPDTLGRLIELRHLSLGYNQLALVPASIGQLTQLETLDLGDNELRSLPDSLGQLSNLTTLDISESKLGDPPAWIASLQHIEDLDISGLRMVQLPDWLFNLTKLQHLNLASNRLTQLSSSIGRLIELRTLILTNNLLEILPKEIGSLSRLDYLCLGFTAGGNPLKSLPDIFDKLTNLEQFTAQQCNLLSLPTSIAKLRKLRAIDLADNPLNPELAAAYKEGVDSVKRYLRAQLAAQVSLNEAKLILVGEGEVGKSSLLAALREDPWTDNRPTTHGIEIKPISVRKSGTRGKITLNGWDFGGQRVYRPTHQLFFSAPAIYLVVWKPREGPQQGLVKEWITLIKHRAPEAKILVVATHGGPKQRQPDIDRQELWDLFGKDTVLDFFLVDSKPDGKTKKRKGVDELRKAITHAAMNLPEVGRTVPKRWEEARQALKKTGAAYLSLERTLTLCRDRNMDLEEAKDFIRISHRMGHLIHYEHDALLQDIVVLKPDWLSTAISFVLDDEQTRRAHGLVSFERLGQLWDDPKRPKDRYPSKFHPIFLRLMERYDLSYRVAEPKKGRSESTSLIAQLVPDVRPPEDDLNAVWHPIPPSGDEQQIQICRVADARTGQSGTAEGLFYQLIVRLHRYSLGRESYADSVHWQRGLILQDDYGARALLEHLGNDVRITVRSPYPARFLHALTYEIKWLVENFWAGLRCDVMVPCVEPCGRKQPGTGLFEVEKLVESKRRKRPDYPCPACDEWQDISGLLHNAPTARQSPLEELLANAAETLIILRDVRRQVRAGRVEIIGRFDGLDAGTKEVMSKVEAGYTGLMRTLTDEAKEGPRLFSIEPVDPGFFDRPKWISEKFRLTLWCEHSRLPLTVFSAENERCGVYDLQLARDWVVKAAPFLKVLTATLGLVVPLASSSAKLALDESVYKGIEKQLEFGQKSIESVLKGSEKLGGWLAESDSPDLEKGDAIRAKGATLRELHAWLKERDPTFGGLVRVQNKRQEFLWVHPQFESEY